MRLRRTKFGSRENARRAGIRSQQVQSERRIAAAGGDPPLRRLRKVCVCRWIEE